eukprot:NODE_1640_length_1269_cov_65.118214_g1625_i0.p2 GENE.NODE_1640_length_1269_cov_65.118214_g1625_i0~~NODE_1640_length_1269_cov_65.118214_g1625_i0.p2  ORF type:complete len:121 (+),score=1.21 NODE_1640_length_1269_cov_65.118214_g1625_i0:286-648(+)
MAQHILTTTLKRVAVTQRRSRPVPALYQDQACCIPAQLLVRGPRAQTFNVLDYRVTNCVKLEYLQPHTSYYWDGGHDHDYHPTETSAFATNRTLLTLRVFPVLRQRRLTKAQATAAGIQK